MTFERTTIEQRLKKLREYVARIEEVGGTPRDAFVADFRHHWLAERGLQLAAEVVLDIANHILASVFHRFPETNEEALDALREAGVISAELRTALQGFGGFRNILVHGYLDIDEGQVHDHLQKAPQALHRFSREVLEWLEQRNKSGT